MSASQAFWTPPSKPVKVPTGHPEEAHLPRDHGQGPSNSPRREEDPRVEGPSTRNVPTSSFANLAVAADYPGATASGSIRVAAMPPTATIESDYPSLRINHLLLDLVSVVHEYRLHV
jgi:hypothetical protein